MGKCILTRGGRTWTHWEWGWNSQIVIVAGGSNNINIKAMSSAVTVPLLRVAQPAKSTKKKKGKYVFVHRYMYVAREMPESEDIKKCQTLRQMANHLRNCHQIECCFVFLAPWLSWNAWLSLIFFLLSAFMASKWMETVKATDCTGEGGEIRWKPFYKNQSQLGQQLNWMGSNFCWALIIIISTDNKLVVS